MRIGIVGATTFRYLSTSDRSSNAASSK